MTELALVVMLGCAPAVPSPKPGPTEVPEVAAVEPTTDASLYVLDVPLIGEDGRSFGLDVERGHRVLVSMFYTSCPMACPLLVERVRGILDEAGPAGLAARVLLVSMDPARDDVAALHAAWSARGLDSRWHLAAPPVERIREVAALLGIAVRQSPDGGFAHSSVVILLDEDGRPLARADGDTGRAELIRALQR